MKIRFSELRFESFCYRTIPLLTYSDIEKINLTKGECSSHVTTAPMETETLHTEHYT